MQRLRDCAAWKYLAVFVAASMVVPYGVLSAPKVAEAQAQTSFGTPSVIVLPITDPTGTSTTVDAQKATDSVALALEASDSFVVTPKRDLQREVADMGLLEPFTVPEQIRLADKLSVEKVLGGDVRQLEVNPSTGEVRVAMSIEMLDVATGEFLDGADVAITTPAISGWSGERNAAVNEALREVADLAVEKLILNRTPPAVVTSVSDTGQVTINLGATDGIKIGNEMVLMRPIYLKDVGEVRLFKMGTIAVHDVSNDMAWAAPLKQGRAKVGDKAYALHMNLSRAQSYQRMTKMKDATKVLLGIGAVIGITIIATGDHTTSPPMDVSARLFQQSPGADAVIRVRVPARSIPTKEQIFDWLFFRRIGQANFPLIADYLVDVWPEPELPGGIWDDDPVERLDVSFSVTHTYISTTQEQKTVSVDLTYNDPALVAGDTYYYRLQRVVTPEERAGSGAPLAQQVSPAQAGTASINVDPQEALSEGSRPTNPVTYFPPVILQSPDDGSQNQSTSSITFSWTTTTGANEYALQVFPEDDPNGVRNPDFQVIQRQDMTGTMSATITGTFASGSRYYWRVGARRIGEATPQSGSLEGWLFSDIRNYTTAVAPPPPPGTSAAGARSPYRQYRSPSGLPRYGH